MDWQLQGSVTILVNYQSLSELSLQRNHNWWLDYELSKRWKCVNNNTPQAALLVCIPHNMFVRHSACNHYGHHTPCHSVTSLCPTVGLWLVSFAFSLDGWVHITLEFTSNVMGIFRVPTLPWDAFSLLGEWTTPDKIMDIPLKCVLAVMRYMWGFWEIQIKVRVPGNETLSTQDGLLVGSLGGDSFSDSLLRTKGPCTWQAKSTKSINKN